MSSDPASEEGKLLKPFLSPTLKSWLLYIFLVIIAMCAACCTWHYSYLLVKKDVTLDKPVMDEKCFRIFSAYYYEMMRDPKMFSEEPEKAVTQFAKLKQFAHHQEARGKQYLIDPIFFLFLIYIISTAIALFHFGCRRMYKQNFFTIQIMPVFQIYCLYLWLFGIFFSFNDALDRIAKKNQEECDFQFANL